MVRPHPAFWRLVHGIMVLYLLFMVYLLMQNVHDARQFLRVRHRGHRPHSDEGLPMPAAHLAAQLCVAATSVVRSALFMCSSQLSCACSTCTQSWAWSYRSGTMAPTAACGCPERASTGRCGARHAALRAAQGRRLRRPRWAAPDGPSQLHCGVADRDVCCHPSCALAHPAGRARHV